jgi:hypothetical protein
MIVYCGANELKELEITGKSAEGIKKVFLRDRGNDIQIYQNYEAPQKGKSPVFTERPKEDIEREQKAAKQKKLRE